MATTLPNEILEIPNPDKKFHEKWYSTRNLINFPHPYRACIFGPPNCGKSTTVLNLILRAHPHFEKIVIVHCDCDNTREYDSLEDVEMLSDIPDVESWDGDVKTLVVVDDIDVKKLNIEQRSNLDRLFGYVSTHKNISPILCSQDPFNVPKSLRAYCNLWILFKTLDEDTLKCAGRRAGLGSKRVIELFAKYIHSPHDSLWVDYTKNTPAHLRKNGYFIIS